MAWGVKPTEYLAWPHLDRALAEGRITLDRLRGSHGIMMDLATDSEMDGWFEAKPVVDFAAAAIERARKEEKDPEPGTRWRVVDTRPSATAHDPSESEHESDEG